MSKSYNAALDSLISKINDKTTTNGQKMVAASNLIQEIEKYMEVNPSDIVKECKTLSIIYDILSRICRLSSVEFAAKGLVERV